MSKWCAPNPLDMGHGIPLDTVGKQAVRILLECFLVVIELVSELKMTTFKKGTKKKLSFAEAIEARYVRIGARGIFKIEKCLKK